MQIKGGAFGKKHSNKKCIAAKRSLSELLINLLVIKHGTAAFGTFAAETQKLRFVLTFSRLLLAARYEKCAEKIPCKKAGSHKALPSSAVCFDLPKHRKEACRDIWLTRGKAGRNYAKDTWETAEWSHVVQKVLLAVVEVLLSSPLNFHIYSI